MSERTGRIFNWPPREQRHCVPDLFLPFSFSFSPEAQPKPWAGQDGGVGPRKAREPMDSSRRQGPPNCGRPNAAPSRRREESSLINT